MRRRRCPQELGGLPSFESPTSLWALKSQLWNPWDLSLREWLLSYVILRAILFIAVEGMVGFFGQFLPKLPTRTGPKPPYQHQLGFRDYAYLVINSFIEFVFVNYLLRLLWYSSQARRAPALERTCALAHTPSRHRHAALSATPER